MSERLPEIHRLTPETNLVIGNCLIMQIKRVKSSRLSRFPPRYGLSLIAPQTRYLNPFFDLSFKPLLMEKQKIYEMGTWPKPLKFEGVPPPHGPVLELRDSPAPPARAFAKEVIENGCLNFDLRFHLKHTDPGIVEGNRALPAAILQNGFLAQGLPSVLDPVRWSWVVLPEHVKLHATIVCKSVTCTAKICPHLWEIYHFLNVKTYDPAACGRVTQNSALAARRYLDLGVPTVLVSSPFIG